MIAFHGMGSSYQLIYVVKELSNTSDTLFSFNFPDHNIDFSPESLSKIAFGTVREILPALYVMKYVVIDKGFKNITLYGFSAGGGVIINVLEALNSTVYEDQLKKIGIGPQEKQQINDALKRGTILLDAPLKSIQEIIEYRGASPELVAIAKQYINNKMEPIETLQRLHDLDYKIIVYFEKPDYILSNRDDNLYFQRLKKANSRGQSFLLEGHTQGHNGAHVALWKKMSDDVY